MPFFPRREEAVVLAVTFGERPPKPENAEKIGMTEVAWDLLTECWKEDKTARPIIIQVLEKFHKITRDSKTTGSPPRVSARKRGAGFSHRN